MPILPKPSIQEAFWTTILDFGSRVIRVVKDDSLSCLVGAVSCGVWYDEGEFAAGGGWFRRRSGGCCYLSRRSSGGVKGGGEERVLLFLVEAAVAREERRGETGRGGAVVE
ncbi:hypothetical protein HAX54_040414 [Datura stramonium]|uniref:Uncharacterized protein n=1 Tax=Datura stramonium TaxID=4076 RepID=A0ABS8RNA8_DATST|nr:hypothetical protein [Datura stramonium]